MAVQYSIEAYRKTVDSPWKIIGVWILDGDSLTYHYFEKDAKAERIADAALARAVEYFGEKMGVKHLRYVGSSSSDYFSRFTEPKTSTDDTDTLIEKVKKLAEKKS